MAAVKHRIRDRRSLPFFQVVKADLDALARAVAEDDSNIRLASVRSVYFALLQVANDQRSETAEVTRKGLVEMSGVSTRTVFDAVRVLEAAGLLEIEKNPGYADVWILASAEEGGSATIAGGVGNDCRGGRQRLPGSYVTGQEEENPPDPPLIEDVDDRRARNFKEWFVQELTTRRGRRPTVNGGWLAAAREIVVGRDGAEIKACVTWGLDRGWWVRKINTLPKLAAAYPDLRMDWVGETHRQAERANGNGRPDRPEHSGVTTDYSGERMVIHR